MNVSLDGTTGHYRVQTVLTETFPGRTNTTVQDKVPAAEAEDRVLWQCSLVTQTQEASSCLFRHGSNTNQLESNAHEKASVLQQEHWEVRDRKVLDHQKMPRKLWGIAFSHKNKLPKSRGKTAYKDSKNRKNILYKSFVECPFTKKINFEIWEFYSRVSKTLKLYVYCSSVHWIFRQYWTG